MSEMAEKLKTNNNRVKTLATKLKAAEMEAADIDKMIFHSSFYNLETDHTTLCISALHGFESQKDDGLSRIEAYEEFENSIED
jgi:hypothetical protein